MLHATPTPHYAAAAAAGLLPHTSRRSVLGTGWPAQEQQPTAAPVTAPVPVNWNQAKARAFHAAVAALAAACGPEYQAATNSNNISGKCSAAILKAVPVPLADGSPKLDEQGQPVVVLEPAASSLMWCDSPAVALSTLRDTAICLRLLPRATIAQQQRLMALYNNAEVSLGEKQAAMVRLRGLYADEAVAWAAEFEQELVRRRAGEKQYAVTGEAYTVPLPQAA